MRSEVTWKSVQDEMLKVAGVGGGIRFLSTADEAVWGGYFGFSAGLVVGLRRHWAAR